MKKETLLILLLSFLATITFAQDKNNSCTISGTLTGGYSDVIYLIYGDVKDSTKVIDSKFAFTVPNLSTPTKSWLHLGRSEVSSLVPLYIENGSITVAADYYRSTTDRGQSLNMITITKVTGSHAQDVADEYDAFYRENMDKENFHDLLFTKLQTFIADNKQQPFSGEILAVLSGGTTLTTAELKQLYSLLDSTKQHKEDLELFNSQVANRE